MLTIARYLAAMQLAVTLAAAAASAQDFVPGELLVRWKPASKLSARAEAMAPLGAAHVASYDWIGVERLTLSGMAVEEALARLALDPRVEYAEPNYIVSASRVPNDEHYPEQYSMSNTAQNGGFAGADISAEAAWDHFTGDPDMLIGDIDTGADYDHPDLAANIWTNPGEIAGNGLDDDGNGYVDDVHGYDFFNHDGDPRDDNGHGTHTAGTIAAVGNNGIGVAGVVWKARIVPMKFLNSQGSGPTSGAIEALRYAQRIGAHVTNNSWGGGFYSRALEDAIIAVGERGDLLIAAAGNARSNTDTSPTYPASLPEECIISVAATDNADQLAPYSNFGLGTVDLAAPGSDVLSTWPGGGYRLLSGTSMAAPHVTGACALLMGRFPGMAAAEVKARLLRFTTPLIGLAGRSVSGGRLNLALSSSDPDSIAPGTPGAFTITARGSNSMDLAWIATGDDSTSGRASRYELRWATSPVTSETFGNATLAGTMRPATSGAPESLRVRGLSTETRYWFALRARDEFGNAGPLAPVIDGATLVAPRISLTPTQISAVGATGERFTRSVEIVNDSPGTLEWNAPAAQLDVASAQQVWPVEVAAKGDEGIVRDPQAESAGGPDAFGYRWSDSGEVGGPAFQWVDVASEVNALPLTGDEAVSDPIPIGFSFPFYGHRFTRLRMCTNGYLEFGNEGAVFVNAGLPTSGAPRNMIAPFWDDLHFGAGVPRAFVRYDGTRCVLTWQGVPRYNDGGSLMTFQCILYPSGEIRFQYLRMVGNTVNATLGIQDSTRAVGLLVAFNQAYVRDSLVVRIVPLRQWLGVQPAAGYLAPGGRQTVQVEMDAAGLGSGTFRGRARFLTNVPAAADTGVAVSFAVSGAPDLVLSTTALEFGAHFIGIRESLRVTVANVGVDPLHVRSVTVNEPAFVAPGSGFTLMPGEAIELTVLFTPPSVAEFSGALLLTSDDPDLPVATLPLHGVGSAAPEIEAVQTQLAAAAAPALRDDAAQRQRTLVLRNTGGATLEWRAATFQGLVSTRPARSLAMPPPIPQVKGGLGPGVGAMGAGGPDAFGYRYVDSDAPGGPTFEWNEIAPVGVRLFGGADDSTTRVALPFPFAFYGQSYDSISVCTNGWLSFVSRESSLVNTDLPSAASGVPRALIAPFWTDLDLRAVRGAGRVYAHYDGTRFIVEWRDAVHFAGAGPYTFQAILLPSGVIEFQYLALGALTRVATVGIQDETGSIGLRAAYNADYAHAGLRVRLSHQDDWLGLDRTAGATAPGGADTLRVTFDARQYKDGDYAGEVRITSNDVEQPLLTVPCALHVGVHREVTDALPGAIAAISHGPLVRLTLSPPSPEATVLPASLRVNGMPVRAVGDLSHEPDGRVVLAFRALDLLGVLPGGDSQPVTLSGEYDRGGWFATTTTLSVTPPSIVGRLLPEFGSSLPMRKFRGHEAVDLEWRPPVGGAEDYEVAYSADGGQRWTVLGNGALPRFAFIPPDTTGQALLEVVARRGDAVLATWLSAPFAVELEAVGAGDAPSPPDRFAFALVGPSPGHGRVQFVLSQPVTGPVQVQVFDVRGAHVRTLLRGSLPSGRQVIAWDGRRQDGGLAAPGMYLVLAQRAGEARSVRVVQVR
jgi:subtilisin family serine protease